MGFQNAAALWSFIGLAASMVILPVGFLYLWYCYYPGGYKKSEVMDLGEYAMFVAESKHEERKKKVEEKEEKEYFQNYDELYHGVEDGYGDQDGDEDDDEYDASLDDGSGYGSKSRQDNSDWQSVGTSEQRDIEGRESYYESSSASPSAYSQSQYTSPSVLSRSRAGYSSPSSHSQSQSAYTYDEQSTLSPSSQATPSQGGSSRPALKYTRDTGSESQYTSGGSSGYY